MESKEIKEEILESTPEENNESNCASEKALIVELENKILQAKADLINFRRRKDEEFAKVLNYKEEDIIHELLPIIDSFERAIDMDNADLSDELSSFLTGFKMILANLIHLLNKFEVKTIDCLYKKFDPVFCNAVMTNEAEGIQSGMVIEILQKGYIYKDKVIRPAMVKVSK